YSSWFGNVTLGMLGRPRNAVLAAHDLERFRQHNHRRHLPPPSPCPFRITKRNRRRPRAVLIGCLLDVCGAYVRNNVSLHLDARTFSLALRIIPGMLPPGQAPQQALLAMATCPPP
ncbi:hypothetical protein A4X06_0g4324, partial [Tilletia controversa]